MKTLIGIDPEEHYCEAMALLARLRFANNVVTLAHVREPILSPLYAAPGFIASGDEHLEASLREASRRLLQEAAGEARAYGLGLTVETLSEVGPKAGVLMDLATDRETDLLAIGSGRMGTLESLFKGSVGRSLAADCVQSFLVARSGTKSGVPVRALYATDLTVYSDRCFDRFLGMAPEGLEEIIVMTAAEHDGTEDLVRQFGYDKEYTGTTEDLYRVATAVGEEMAERARSLGHRCSFSWEDGYAREALPAAMERARADLLVMGARGHKFIERLFRGSVAYHEVAAEPYSVMVVRAPEPHLLMK